MNNSLQVDPTRRRPMKLSTSVSLMVSAVIATVLLIVHLFYFFQISDITREAVQGKALAVARTLADSPEIRNGLQYPAQEGTIQALANAAQKSNDLLFVVVTNMDGVRHSHPDRSLIGRRFIGNDLQPALLGQENVAVNHGNLEEALRVFTLVYNDRHKQIGVVVIGISLNEIMQQVNKSRWNIVWTALLGALVGGLGTFLLVRAAKRILSGREPYEISVLFEQRQLMLESMKEGVIAIDDRSQVTLINHAARLLLCETDIQENDADISLMVAGSGPLIARLRKVLLTGEPKRDEEIDFRGHPLLCNTMPLRSDGAITGAICTFRDKTEVSQLMQRMDGLVSYVDALRERSHEFMNKLHVILGLLHLNNYGKMEEYILKTANNYQAEVGSLLGKIKSPIVAGFLLSKVARASDTGNRLLISEDSFLPDSGSEQQVTALITVLGNLIENALDAAGEEGDGEISVLLYSHNGWLCCEVSDDGPGINADRLESVFDKGVSSKGEHRGVGLFLARQQTESLGGKIIVESEPGVYTQFFVQLPWDTESKNA